MTPHKSNKLLVEIKIDVGVAQVKPACIDALGPLLQFEQVEFQKKGGRLRHERKTQSAYKLMPDDRLIVAAGCVRRVRRELERLGHAVTVQDLRSLKGDPCHVDEKHRAEAEKAFSGLARAIENNVQGAIAAPRGSTRDAMIGHITRLLPKPRIFVACATLECVKRVGAALGPFVGGNVGVVRGGDWRSPCRVVCGTYKSLDHSQPSDWPVLIFEDAIEATGRATFDARGEYGRNRVYALVDPSHHRSPADELKLEVLAGPVIYSVSGGRKRPPVTVRLAAYPAPANQLPAEPRQRKQHLWRHPQRNRAIADVAQAHVDRDDSALWQRGLYLDAQTVTAPSEKPAVIVVVESVDHAEILAKLLPDWHVFHAGDNVTDVPTVARNDLWGVPPCSIVTIVYANECRHLAADVLIVAAGGTHPQIPLAMDERRVPLTIIDFADVFDAAAEAETQERLRVYRELGFDVRVKEPEVAGPDIHNRRKRRSSQRRKQNTSRRPRRPQRR